MDPGKFLCREIDLRQFMQEVSGVAKDFPGGLD